MQCPECSYISFKTKKACGTCGFKFKKKQKGPSLLKKESFSVFLVSPVKQEKEDSIGLLKAPEPGYFIDPETGDFKLDLPGIEDEEIEEAQIIFDSGKEISKYEPLRLHPNTDICLGEMEVKGLGLEPFQTIEEGKTKETQSAETEPSAIEVPRTSDENPYLEPALEISEPEGEPRTPELDLGFNEVKLDLSYEPPPPNKPDPVANLLDMPHLNLEINDSDDPLIAQKNEIPDIEIEELGLELEPPDEPKNDKT